MKKPLFGVSICAHNESDYIVYCLKSIYDFAHVIAVSVNTGIPWGGVPEPLDNTLELVQSFPDPQNKLRIITGEWANEMEQRVKTAEMVKPEANYLMTVDADEIYCKNDLARLRRLVTLLPFVGQFRIRMRTYWKIRPFYVIDPPEPHRRYLISRLRQSTRLIGFSGKTNERFRYVIPRSIAVCHHFSYARTNERMLQKIRNTSHRDELIKGWFENVWLKWDTDHNLQNLHPTHPAEFKRAIPVKIDSLPEVMRDHPYAHPE
jgi:hypothetical protein